MIRLDTLFLKYNSFDTKAFIQEAAAFSPNSIILVLDFEKIAVKYAAPGLEIRQSSFRLYYGKAHISWLKPFIFLLDLLLMLRLFVSLCLRFKPRTCWIESTYAAFLMCLIKLFGGCQRLIYLPGDWLVNKRHKKFLSILNCNIIFPKLDYIVSRMSDVVIYGDERLALARHTYWGRKISSSEKIYNPVEFPGISLIQENSTEIKKCICFLGDARLDSGLDIAIRALGDLRQKEDIRLKVIGPPSSQMDNFKNLAKTVRLDRYVTFMGFVQTEALKEALADCFCGLNLLTQRDSYSSYGIPGKQIHYLQFLLSVIATDNAGTLVPIIRQKRLGVIIDPTSEDLQAAVWETFSNQQRYRVNIIDFIKSIKRVNIKTLIEA